jgi:hypothetical protein
MIGLREDQRVRVQLVSRINALFPVASGLFVASGLVESSHRPRWAAKQPQNQPLGCD